jgi:hypothetical protein
LAIIIRAPPATATVSTATITSTALAAASWGLIALLFDQLIQLTVFQHLTQGSQGETENSHGGAKVEGLLQRTGRTHLVLAQADAESTAFAVARATAATAAASTTFTAVTVTARTVALSPLLLGFAVGITHGPWPGIRRKCAASTVCCPKPSAADDLSLPLLGAAPASGWWPHPLRWSADSS